jgi:hypothetical protein
MNLFTGQRLRVPRRRRGAGEYDEVPIPAEAQPRYDQYREAMIEA